MNVVAFVFRGDPQLKVAKIALVLWGHIVHDIEVLHNQIAKYPSVLLSMDWFEHRYVAVVLVLADKVAGYEQIPEIHFELVPSAVLVIADREKDVHQFNRLFDLIAGLLESTGASLICVAIDVIKTVVIRDVFCPSQEVLVRNIDVGDLRLK